MHCFDSCLLYWCLALLNSELCGSLFIHLFVFQGSFLPHWIFEHGFVKTSIFFRGFYLALYAFNLFCSETTTHLTISRIFFSLIKWFLFVQWNVSCIIINVGFCLARSKVKLIYHTYVHVSIELQSLYLVPQSILQLTYVQLAVSLLNCFWVMFVSRFCFHY